MADGPAQNSEATGAPFEIEVAGRRFVFEPGEMGGDHVLETIRTTGAFYEADLLDWLGTLRVPEGRFVDAGAFVGNHTIYFAGVLGREVVAYEPNPVAYERLTAHVAANDVSDRVRTERLGLSDRAGWASLIDSPVPNNRGGASLAPRASGEIELVGLDEHLGSPDDIACMKLDVEGMEIDALRGARATIEASRPLLLVECMTQPAFARISAELSALNYEPIGTHAATPVIAFAATERAAAYFADGRAPSFDLAYHLRRSHIERIALAGRQIKAIQDVRVAISRVPSELSVSVTSFVERIETTLDAIRTDLKAVAEREAGVPALEAAMKQLPDALGAQISAAEARSKADRQARRDDEARTAEAVRGSLSEIMAAIQANRAEAEALLSQRDAAQAEAQALQARVEALAEAAEASEQERVAARASFEDTWGRLAETERLLAQLRARALEHNDELRIYKARVAELRSELAERRRSRSAQLSDAMARAVRHPGRDTVALPWRAARLLAGRRTAAAPPPLPRAPRALTIAKRPPLEQAPPVRPDLPVSKGRTHAATLPPTESTVIVRRRRAGPFPIRDLRVALIADEFTRLNLAATCTVCDLGAEDWRERIDGFEPDLLFVESAWRGREGSWHRRLTNEDPTFRDLMDAFDHAGVPRVFWNKEDPIHFDGWIPVASRFDHVFTTDLESIPRYVTMLGHERVGCMPFACAPELTGPLREEPRRDGYAFAGSYYHRYPDRARDFDTIADLAAASSELTIYDRNYDSDQAEFAFPERYAPYLEPALPFDRIDEAYKGYAFGINMNSIKQSPTMFARRVFELIASRTAVVGNYAHGVRLLLGDLTVSSDGAPTLRERMNELEDPEACERLTRRALRKVLAEHTYAHRLHDVCGAVGIEATLPFERVTMLASIRSGEEARRVSAAMARQDHEACSLVLVAGEGCGLTPHDVPENAELLWRGSGEEAFWQRDHDAVAVLAPGARYDASHVTDLVQTRRYADRSDGATRPVLPGQRPHTRTQTARPSASLFTAEAAERIGLATLIADDPVQGEFVTIAGEGYAAPGVDPAAANVPKAFADEGVSMATIRRAAVRARRDAANRSEDRFVLFGEALASELAHHRTGTVRFEGRPEGTYLSSDLDDGAHAYAYGTSQFDIAPLLRPDGALTVYAETSGGARLRAVLAFWDANGEKLSAAILPTDRTHEVPVPEGAVRVQLGLRVLGTGHTVLRRVRFGVPDGSTRVFVPRSDTLVLTQAYPSYDDIYRNGFVHRRVQTYRDAGFVCDVLRFDPTKSPRRYEFEGIDVSVGYQDELRAALATGAYRRVLVHFLDAAMWSILREFLPSIELTVWLHGSEVQPWHRRDFNYASDAERAAAIAQSEDRMALWRDVFGLRHPRVRFVMVSAYARDEIAEDTGITLADWQYEIVHNFIDTDLFAYVEKPSEQRFAVLSIRPFASRKYANDLAVNAILLMQERPDADRFSFRLVGDGPLFEETVAPLRGIPNVTLDRRFLRQPEIAALHREFGVWLNPTRMDWQGVSRDEAMSSGLVPVTTDVAAIPEFVSEAEGFLAPPEDAAALAAAMGRLAEDEEAFGRMSAAAAARARRQSGLDQTIRREIEIVWGTSAACDIESTGASG